MSREVMLRCGTDLVTASALIQAVKAINPDIVVLEEGTTGGSCELTPLGELGAGANGFVERCRLKISGDNFEQLVAVKRFHTTQRPNVQQVNHFLREASVLGCLSHPNIIRLLGIGTVDGTLQRLYTALELAAGPSLLSVLERQVVAPGMAAYSTRDALRWCIQIASALMYIHTQHHLIHRDIKLRNLALTADDPSVADIKLLDWGLACKEVAVPPVAPSIVTQHPSPVSSSDNLPSSARGGHRANSRPRRTISSDAVARPASSHFASHKPHRLPGTKKPLVQKSVTFSSRSDIRTAHMSSPFHSHLDEAMFMNTGSTGTPIYSSPEARLTTVVDQKSDMYSFGMVVYELFNYTTVLYQAALASHTSGTGAVAMVDGSWVPEFRPHCPQCIVSLVRDCWARDPRERPTAAEVLKRLSAMDVKAEQQQQEEVLRSRRVDDEQVGVSGGEGGKVGTGNDKSSKIMGAIDDRHAEKVGGLFRLFPCLQGSVKEER